MNRTTPAAPLRALIVDLDGTVADTFPAMSAAYDAATGRQVPEQELLRLFGPGAGTEAQILAALDAGGPDALETWYRAYQEAHAALSLFEGVRDALTFARARGVRTAMLTGKGRRSTLITLAALGLDTLLDVIITGDEAPAPKPDPRGLLLAARSLAVRPDEALYVGDSLADLGAARAAGMRFAAARWDPRASIAAATEPCDFDCAEASDVVKIVDTLTRKDPGAG